MLGRGDAKPVAQASGDGLRFRVPADRVIGGARLEMDQPALRRVLLGAEVLAVIELFSSTPHESTDESRQLMADVSAQLAQVLERERTAEQIAELVWREQQDLLHTLHDSLGQTLTGLGMLSTGLSQRMATADATTAEIAQQIAAEARNALEEVRQVSRGLFPVDLDAEGLGPALRHLATTTHAMHGIRVEVRDQAAGWPSSGRTATQLYRIAQEAVTNAVKHARATAIEIRYGVDRSRGVLTVVDDGVGIERGRAVSDGLGLRIMKHRAASIGGTLTVERGDGGGTVVTCVVPARLALTSAATAATASRTTRSR